MNEIQYAERWKDLNFRKVCEQIQVMEITIFPLDQRYEGKGNNIRYNHVADFREGFLGTRLLTMAPDDAIKLYHEELCFMIFGNSKNGFIEMFSSNEGIEEGEENL